MKVPVWRNPVFLAGASVLVVTGLFVLMPEATAPDMFNLVAPPLGADGRCTGFPNGFGRYDWSECCSVHDAGGTDATLISCLLDPSNSPAWAMPIVCLGVAAMGFCRPGYNLLQRWGWVK